jgi:hypothetical protein
MSVGQHLAQQRACGAAHSLDETRQDVRRLRRFTPVGVTGGGLQASIYRVRRMRLSQEFPLG